MINDPLSFSQNIYQDLRVIIRDALLKLGVSENSLIGFDSHSTISILFTDDQELNISLSNDRLFIWSPIRLTEDQLLVHSRDILPILTETIEYVETGNLTLSRIEEGYELKALVELIALTENNFSQVINDFYRKFNSFQNIIKR